MSALDALVDVNAVRLFDHASDCANRTLSCAGRATLTLVFNDLELDKTLTDVARTLLVNDVCNVFVTEIAEG